MANNEIKTFHVLHFTQDKKWYVKEDSEGIVVSYFSKEEALNKAIEMAESVRKIKRRIIVHETDHITRMVENG